MAQVAQKLGISEIDDEAYKRAVALAQQQRNTLGILMLARLASQREDWQTVIALLDNNIDTDVASEELYLLVSAFVNENPTRRRAITFFDELDPSISSLPVYQSARTFAEQTR